MRNSLPEHSLLLLIDIQQGYDDPIWGKRNNPQAEENMAKILNIWRKNRRPLVHVQHLARDIHSPLHPDKEGVDFKEMVVPLKHEVVIQKRAHCAFFDTNLKRFLDRKGYDSIIIIGLTTNHSVSMTAQTAEDHGYNAYVVSDATAAFGCTSFDGNEYSADEIHNLSLASMHDEFATIFTTEQVEVLTKPRWG